MYLTTIYFAGQPKNLLVDTGSSWTWVAGFDRNASPTLKCTNQTKFIQYGIGFINGEICYDNVGLKLNFTANMPFIVADQKTHFERYDGILGLSPKDESAGPLLPDYLLPDRKVFSILLNGKNSKIEFGSFENHEAMIAHRISGSFHWEI